MRRSPHVAILGAGIMGTSTALLLAKRGISSTLFDVSPAPMSHASRWNEGKIHLGFLYAGDPSLNTARQLMLGGLVFKEKIEKLIGCSLDDNITTEDETYLIHRDSIVGADQVLHYFNSVAALLCDTGEGKNYLVDVSRARIATLSRQDIGHIADRRYVAAAFRVPERSVSTVWLADQLVSATKAEVRIEQIMRTRVTGIRPREDTDGTQWTVETGNFEHGPFDWVVNCLWQGKLAIDSKLGLRPLSEWSHRYRLALFIRTARPVKCPSAVIAVGPFGDIKSYNDRTFYLSWYPGGLIAEDCSLEPPSPIIGDAARSRVVESTISKLEMILPIARAIYAQRQSMDVDGGWVFAMGAGSLANVASTIHRRDRIGIYQHGTYITVDTGKYSMAPLLAEKAVSLIR